MTSSIQPLPFVCSWSGGKDSAFALLEAKRLGHHPVALINMLDSDGQRSRAHGLTPALLQAQADALGLPLLQGKAGWGEYEAEFSRLLRQCKNELGVKAVVFGDIDLEAHKEWEERITAHIGLQTLLPLWQRDRRQLVEQMLNEGIKTLITACRDPLPKRLLGQQLTPELIQEIETLDGCCCGEDGEYHSTLYDCSLFSQPLTLVPGAVNHRNGYWQLDLDLP